MGRPLPYLQATLAALLPCCTLVGQTAFPDHVERGTWTSGIHHTAVTQKIISPGDVHEDMVITLTADAEFISGTSVRLTPGFHAGALTANGMFHAYINPALGPDGEVVLVAPDPATAITGNMLHVPKWEKLEVGLRLPQEFRDAIDRFFGHYYANPADTYAATPGSVDHAHDLNPYADDSLQLVMALTRPDGSQALKWGYFMREGKWQGTTDTALPLEDPDAPLHPFHIRFRPAPDMEGPWSFSLSLKAPQTLDTAGSPLPAVQYTGYAFVCDPPLPDNHGPLQVDAVNRRTLKFEDGTPYFGLGTNLEATGFGTSSNDPDSYRLVRRNFVNITSAMEQLHSVGGNFSRLFMMNKSLAPENSNLGVYDKFSDPVGCTRNISEQGSGQRNAWVMDQMADTARKYGIQLQLCIMPYPPIVAYESYTWLNDPYLHHFVAPRDSATGLYDMKRYFYSNGDPQTADNPGGAFYYWKRRYKYIMNRWGYAAHIPIIEPFNEIDQMLTYNQRNLADKHTICAENQFTWPADTTLPLVYDQWLSNIIQYVKGGVDWGDPLAGGLGEGTKLFLAGNHWQPGDPERYLLPNRNPNVDLVDEHHGMYWGGEEMANSFDQSQANREAFTSANGNTERPYHQGESNYYQLVDLNPLDTVTDWYESAKIFDNYDVSFHNELWAGAFFGNFATMSTWHKARVFWWLRDDEGNRPPYDGNNPHYVLYPRTAALHGINALKIQNDTIPLLIENRTLYHHFKPLSDFLNNVAMDPGGFFDQDHEPRKVYDDNGRLECYYLLNADQTMAIGWVHNLNAYWEKHYYVTSQYQHYLECDSPNASSLALPGFSPGIDYQVTWFPTRMNMTELPADQEDGSQTGTVTLDLSSLPFNGLHSWLDHDNLDTLRSDYAFMIHALPELRMMPVAGSDSSLAPQGWDFSLLPNPTTGELTVLLPDGPPVNLYIIDMAGRQLRQIEGLSEGAHHLDLRDLVPGAYGVRATAGTTIRTKLLIKR